MSRFAQRRDRLRRLFLKQGANAMLVTNEINVTYLTGFTGDSSFLLLTRDKDLILSDPRYTEQLDEECPVIDLAIRKPGTSHTQLTVKTLKKAKIDSLAVEADSMTLTWQGVLQQGVPRIDLVPTSGLVEELRAVKDRQEIAAIRQSIQVAERAFAVIRAQLRPEQTEREVAHNLEHTIRQFGGEACSFDPIVAVGPRAALPHAVPGDRQIGESDFTLIDWGAQVEHYMSDLTRIMVVGRISPKLERIYGVVLNAQQAAINAIRPGARLHDVDAAARNVIADAGFEKQFGHGLGHGFGLEIHEHPRMAVDAPGELKAGMVVTGEPGIDIPQWGGVRIEDDILVTKDGHDVLTNVPKGLAESQIV